MQVIIMTPRSGLAVGAGRGGLRRPFQARHLNADMRALESTWSSCIEEHVVVISPFLESTLISTDEVRCFNFHLDFDALTFDC
jgi:hypothetical protein